MRPALVTFEPSRRKEPLRALAARDRLPAEAHEFHEGLGVWVAPHARRLAQPLALLKEKHLAALAHRAADASAPTPRPDERHRFTP